MYQLSDIDIRLLRVFRAVVECRGFANARALLNIGESTISNHMGKLEERLGFRLCDRGRTGFRLTQKGERVYEELILLFKAHESFQNATLELKSKLGGLLRIGVIDSIITDQVCPVIRGLNLLNSKTREVTIDLAPHDAQPIGTGASEHPDRRGDRPVRTQAARSEIQADLLRAQLAVLLPWPRDINAERYRRHR